MCLWSFVLILHVLFCVFLRACGARAHSLKYVFVRFCTLQCELNKILRFYALTLKIMYLGQFFNLVCRPCNLVPYKGMFLIFNLLISHSINPNHKLTYLLLVLF